MSFSPGKKFFYLFKMLFLILLCFTFWILISFDFTPQAIVTGFIFSVITALLTHTYFFKSEILKKYHFLYRIDLIILYVVLLIIQSYLASFTLMYQMVTGKHTPGVIRIKTRLKSKLSRAILANTITLIPGTMTLWLEGRFLYIHCFDIPHSHSLIAGKIIKGKQEKILQELFG